MKNQMGKIRLEHELAESIDKWGWKYHHLGIPTNLKMSNEKNCNINAHNS